MHKRGLWGSDPFEKIQLHSDRLGIPLHWKKPRKIFTVSMGDIFHENVAISFQEEIWRVMISSPQHTFQILTKRADIMRKRVPQIMQCIPSLVSVPNNIWLGVTAENQARADERIPLLLQTPASVRFVSCEPLLGSILFNRRHVHCPTHDFSGGFCSGYCPDQRYIDWLICGGETGPGARPIHPEWVRYLRDQCQAAGVPFHFKQWGEWIPQSERYIPGILSKQIFNWDKPGFPGLAVDGDCKCSFRVSKKSAGRMLDGREWLEFPEVAQ